MTLGYIHIYIYLPLEYLDVNVTRKVFESKYKGMGSIGQSSHFVENVATYPQGV